MKRYVVLHKNVGETPLQCAETWRASQSDTYKDVPLAYAGRLDPMASGKLLVLIGDECKQQERYHALDKSYTFEVLFGIHSDTADVLGLVEVAPATPVTKVKLEGVAQRFTGDITLPYPHFSSKTIKGKPLHVWTLEGRLDEITIPTKTSTIYSLKLNSLKTYSVEDIYKTALTNINSIETVTDPRKALGNDFRRSDVRTCWNTIKENNSGSSYQIASFTCISSSGTYMRTLAEEIAKACGTKGLAFSIDRTIIGRYQPLPFSLGFWRQKL